MNIHCKLIKVLDFLLLGGGWIEVELCSLIKNLNVSGWWCDTKFEAYENRGYDNGYDEKFLGYFNFSTPEQFKVGYEICINS